MTIVPASRRSAASNAAVMPAASRARPSAGERSPGTVGSTGLTPSSWCGAWTANETGRDAWAPIVARSPGVSGPFTYAWMPSSRPSRASRASASNEAGSRTLTAPAMRYGRGGDIGPPLGADP